MESLSNQYVWNLFQIKWMIWKSFQWKPFQINTFEIFFTSSEWFEKDFNESHCNSMHLKSFSNHVNDLVCDRSIKIIKITYAVLRLNSWINRKYFLLLFWVGLSEITDICSHGTVSFHSYNFCSVSICWCMWMCVY